MLPAFVFFGGIEGCQNADIDQQAAVSAPLA